MRVVEVVWNDAHASLEESTVSSAKKTKPILTRTVAFLMAENDHGITLATDIYPDDPKHGKMINFVPWGMVEEYWEYSDK